MIATDRSGIVAENVVRNDEYWRLIKDAAEAIYEQLSYHCGPSATTALIAFPGDTTASGKFTADGITIVENMTFSSTKNPVFEVIREMAVSVGRAVDAVAKDGTTTSMMLFAATIKNLVRKRLEGDMSDSPIEIRRTFDNIRRDLKRRIKSARPADIRRAVTLSCRNDKQVVDAVMTMVKRLPKAFLETYTVYLAGKDQKDGIRISVEENKYPIKTDVTVYGNPANYMNDAFGQRFSDDNTTVLFYNPLYYGKAEGRMLHGACALIKTLFDQIFLDENLVPFDKPDLSRLEHEDSLVILDKNTSLVIVAPQVADIASYGFTSPKPFSTFGVNGNHWTVLDAINAINGEFKNGNHPARIILASPAGDSHNNASFLLNWLPSAVDGINHDDTHGLDCGDGKIGTFVFNARTHFDGRNLRMGKLFDDHGINPKYNPSFMTKKEGDSKYIENLREMMNVCKMTNITMADDAAKAQRIANEVTPMLLGMVMASVPRIVITGDVHSELHDQEVVKDAIGSAMSIINMGIIDAPWYYLGSSKEDGTSALAYAVREVNHTLVMMSGNNPDFISVGEWDASKRQLPVPAAGVMETLFKIEEFASMISGSSSIIMSNARASVENTKDND